MHKIQSNNKYSASFTAGGLLFQESIALLPYLNDNSISKINEQTTNNTLLQINSESARKRIITEIRKRYNSVNKDVFYQLKKSTINEQKILLYFICLKSYPLIFDFVFDIVVNKWLSRELEISSVDVIKFLYMKCDKHPEIEEWTLKTHNKISSVIIKILKDVGFVKDGKLIPVNLSHSFWKYFFQIGETWFLKAALLNQEQREQIIG